MRVRISRDGTGEAGGSTGASFTWGSVVGRRLGGHATMQHDVSLLRQAVSQHLTVLEEAGSVRTRHEVRYEVHTLRTEPLRGLVDRWLDDA